MKKVFCTGCYYLDWQEKEGSCYKFPVYQIKDSPISPKGTFVKIGNPLVLNKNNNCKGFTPIEEMKND
jgi:hypothetical protein